MRAGVERPDEQLLDSFLRQRDEAAFAALLQRHGPMVLQVCTRVLGRTQDVEDAFQATFLVFTRKAATIRKPESVGSWLHGVALLQGGGIADIITMNSPNLFSSGSISVLLGHGDGTFAAPVNYQVGVDPAEVIVGDFEGDGIRDVAVANSFSNSVSVLRGNGDGTFQTAVDYLVGLAPRSLVAADFNGDGALDLAVANDHSNNVSVLFNQGGALRPAPSIGAAGAIPGAAIAALFAASRPESQNSVAASQPPLAAAMTAAFAATRLEALALAPQQQAVPNSGAVSP